MLVLTVEGFPIGLSLLVVTLWCIIIGWNRNGGEGDWLMAHQTLRKDKDESKHQMAEKLPRHIYWSTSKGPMCHMCKVRTIWWRGAYQRTSRGCRGTQNLFHNCIYKNLLPKVWSLLIFLEIRTGTKMVLLQWILTEGDNKEYLSLFKSVRPLWAAVETRVNGIRAQTEQSVCKCS